MLPGGTTLKLKRFEGLQSTDGTLIAVYDAEVPNPPSSAGSRLMLPTSIFERADSPFQHEKRKHPVYFSYPYQVLDNVTLRMPDGMEIEAVPDKKHEEPGFAYFDVQWTAKGNSVEMKRGFAVMDLLYKDSEYPQIRDFFAKVASGDQETVVLRAAKNTH
jgi:hypothetical protein